jgi:hypothetical protein
MWRFVFSPVEFFEARRCGQPDWWLAGLAPLSCAGLQLAAALVVAAKVQPDIEALTAALGVSAGMVPSGHVFAFFGVAGYPVACGAVVLAAIALDGWLGGVGRPARLAEGAVWCFYSHVPSAAFALAAAWWWEPRPIRIAPGLGSADVVALASEYQAAVVNAPLFLTSRVIASYAALWLIGLLAVLLRVESRLPTSGVVVAVAVLLVVAAAAGFVGPGLPAAVRFLV